MGKDETDQQRIDEWLVKFEKGELTRQEVSHKLLDILIRISGERLQGLEKAKHDVYHYLLTNGMIKPEFQKQVYVRMMEIEKKL